MDTDRPPMFDKIVSSLKTADLSETTSLEETIKVADNLHGLLTSANGVQLLKQPNQNFEVVMPLFTKMLFHSDSELSKRCIQHICVVLEIFRSKIPKVKKSGWWEKFELGLLIELIPKLESKISPSDDSWVHIWIFVANIIINDVPLSTKPLNKLLSISEAAFKKGRNDVGILDKAWRCWMGLIDAFGRSPKILVPSRTLCLLTKPLFACTNLSRYRVSTWAHLIEVKGNEENVKQLVESMCKAMFKAGEKSMGRHHPDDCTEALIKILRLDGVVQQCLPEIIEEFGSCINSRPSGGLIEQLACAFLRAINATANDAEAYKLWKRLIDQYNGCTDGPILSQACQIFFTDVNFLRWVETSVVTGKEIALLMPSSAFREKVLLRCVKLFTADADNCESKPGKAPIDEIWSTYCDAYILWWSSGNALSPGDVETPEAGSHQTHDVQSVQCLLLLPIKRNMWSPAVCKTWTHLCEACHNSKLLHLMVKPLLGALLEEPHFQAVKTIDVLNCLFGLDSSFCKHAVELVDTLASTVHAMEVKNVMDVLNLLETASIFPEMNSAIGKMTKFIHERCLDFDQLSVHKIRTKVGKISRKMETLANSVEKEKHPSKAQRTPFRTQSNFLQRLAKAEEKNKTKSPFLTAIFSNTEKAKTGGENGEEPLNGDVSMDTSQENSAEIDDSKKATDLDDTENVPIILLPPLKGTNENCDTEKIVAEKENVILPNATVAPPIASPGCKLKITNAREVKTVDASSPVHPKKPKPAAGQKSTPKKVTPSKVSYFDDDANDCVMVPPKPKTTPLTEHQMEMMSKRRTDIPALYQDLSQDTQTSQQPSTVVQEISSGASPGHVVDSQDIVLGTPSPIERTLIATPELPKSKGRSSVSAKKLDFNGVSTPPSKASLADEALAREMSPTSEIKSQSEVDSALKAADGRVKLTTAYAQLRRYETPEKTGSVKEEPSEEKVKRKRKSEPAKFSPKQTRSKKHLKPVSPDAKSTKLNVPDPETSSGIPPELGVEPLSCKSGQVEPKTPTKCQQPVEPPRPKSPQPASPNAGDILETSQVETGKISTPQKCDTLEPAFVPDCEMSDAKPDDSISRHNEGEGESHTKPNGPSEPENMPMAKGSCSKEKSTRKRKHKNDGSPVGDGPKKLKAGDEGSSAKKGDPVKKKKKMFKLGCANNLENWLLKTDRVPSSVVVPDVKTVKTETDNAMSSEAETVEAVSNEPNLEKVSDEAIESLNNSDEIVPSTQESSAENPKTPLVVPIELKVEETRALNSDLNVMEKKELDCAPIPADANNTSPEKPEGSALLRLSQESPNDDIVMYISPSKRQRRASSVFRGEGDTYLTKEKFLSDNTEEAEDDSKPSLRGRNKTSPSTMMNLHQPSGRSAKMLRLAANSTSHDSDNAGVTTPLQRRKSIVPFRYGENWPKGPTEDWVACTPVSPFASPFRSALKKTPEPEGNVTPQRGPSRDSKGSPLLSSAKRKRVVFLDPPVTRGLIYELGSGSTGSIHLADIPRGSPYPTWKDEDDRCSGLTPEPKTYVTPPKHDRLNSVHGRAELKEEDALGSPSSTSISEELKLPVEPKPDSSEVEVTEAVHPPEPTIVPSQEPDMIQIKEKFNLPDAFMSSLEELDARIRDLILGCFDSPSMIDVVDSWTFGDCREVCQLPHSFLLKVKNLNGDVLTDVLSDAVFAAPSDKPAPLFSEKLAQTEPLPLTENSAQTQLSLVHLETRHADTNTAVPTPCDSSTQADLELPTAEDLTALLKKMGRQRALLYFSESLKLLSSLDA